MMKINNVVKSDYAILPKVHEKGRIKGFTVKHSAGNKKNLSGSAGIGNERNALNDTRLLETVFQQAIPGFEKRINILSM